ncbi:helix-turn-helix domain-containing protein [Microtetraspora malaysiensis]|uniref:helix-turn-helix domain-containing protein n=1 Tax=Microtetraspora malaysiensis TaxID=161358 RepID=UPI003D8E07E7
MTLKSSQLLRAIMGERSARALAREHCFSHQVLSRLASGRRTSCSRGQAEAIARALDVQLGDLFMPSTPTKIFVTKEAAA